VGDRCVLTSDSRYTALGVNHPVVLRTLTPSASIRIGCDCGLSGATICSATRVDIGEACLFGANVTVVDTDFHPLSSEGRRYNSDQAKVGTGPVLIEDNVFIGMSSVILKNSVIGAGSVVGAASVVTGRFPPATLLAGNPARVIRKID
jgi:acetyltransferase-like isoleucine patch superfamily enzyme